MRYQSFDSVLQLMATRPTAPHHARVGQAPAVAAPAPPSPPPPPAPPAQAAPAPPAPARGGGIGAILGLGILAAGVGLVAKAMHDQENDAEKEEQLLDSVDDALEGDVIETTGYTVELRPSQEARARQLASWGDMYPHPHNPPAWVRDESTWERAKAEVRPYWHTYRQPWAVVAHVYERMGGRIG